MRPELLLYVHVLAATVLFGSLATLAVLGAAGRRRVEREALAVASLRATLAVAVPAWVLMFVFGSWARSKEGVPSSTAWLGIGVGIATAGIAVLLALSAIAYAWTRRPESAGPPAVLALLSAGYLVALAVAWWVMTTKLPA
jgi:hypothetical protein